MKKNSVRKSSIVTRRGANSANQSPDGEKPSDFLAHITKLTAKQRSILYEQLVSHTRFPCTVFLQNKEKNRAMIPISDKKRIKLAQGREGDGDYVPAVYATCERDDYILIQAPKKENYIDLWRTVWQDGCKIIVSVSDKLSESDGELCYPYWPQKEKDIMSIQKDRFVIKCVKRVENKGFVTYELTLSSTEECDAIGKASAANLASKSDSHEEEGEDEKKPRPITLYHVDNWQHDTWPDIDQLAVFVQTLSKKEIQIVRKSTDNYVPPVVLQGHDAIGRTCVLWVMTILMKDIEKKECIDVDDLIKKLMSPRIRPGAFCNRLHLCIVYALAFRCSALGAWMSVDDARSRVKEIQQAYIDSLSDSQAQQSSNAPSTEKSVRKEMKPAAIPIVKK